MCQSY
jgi:hypothetical protein